jgi:hypothetical protein
MAVLQVVGGFLIDKFYDARRISIPWYDKMHWYMGRIAGSLGYVNIGLGIALYGAVGNDVSAFGIAFIVWTVLLIISFIWAGIRFGQTHDEPVYKPSRPSLSGYSQMGDPEYSIPLSDL